MFKVNRYMVGYVCENSNTHVCGYKNNKILVQLEGNRSVKQLNLYTNKKGVFFNAKGKRIYLKYVFKTF